MIEGRVKAIKSCIKCGWEFIEIDDKAISLDYVNALSNDFYEYYETVVKAVRVDDKYVCPACSRTLHEILGHTKEKIMELCGANFITITDFKRELRNIIKEQCDACKKLAISSNCAGCEFNVLKAYFLSSKPTAREVVEHFLHDECPTDVYNICPETKDGSPKCDDCAPTRKGCANSHIWQLLFNLREFLRSITCLLDPTVVSLIKDKRYLKYSLRDMLNSIKFFKEER